MLRLLLLADDDSMGVVGRLRAFAVLGGELEPGESGQIILPFLPPAANVMSDVEAHHPPQSPQHPGTKRQVDFGGFHAKTGQVPRQFLGKHNTRTTDTALAAFLVRGEPQHNVKAVAGSAPFGHVPRLAEHIAYPPASLFL
jgi:hypothetical protein